MIVRTSPRLARSGFTLMEMMIVVAIIVALAGMGIFMMSGQADEAYVAKAKADMQSIVQAAESYRLKSPTKQYPTDMTQLTGMGLLKSIQTPWGDAYQLQLVNNRIVVSCQTPMGQLTSND